MYPAFKMGTVWQLMKPPANASLIAVTHKQRNLKNGMVAARDCRDTRSQSSVPLNLRWGADEGAWANVVCETVG